jgi:hypothetical protein
MGHAAMQTEEMLCDLGQPLWHGFLNVELPQAAPAKAVRLQSKAA